MSPRHSFQFNAMSRRRSSSLLHQFSEFHNGDKRLESGAFSKNVHFWAWMDGFFFLTFRMRRQEREGICLTGKEDYAKSEKSFCLEHEGENMGKLDGESN